MSTYFYAVAIQDDFIRSYLDLLRFIANPNEKRTAHITVRGPYSKKVNLEKQSKMIHGENVQVVGVDKFYSQSQNTLFLRCESKGLREIWLKKGHPYNPHITIYDGKDRLLADSLLEIMSKYHISFHFPASQLYPLLIRKGQSNIDLALCADFPLLGRLLRRGIDVDHIRNMPLSQRIGLFSEACSFLPHLRQLKQV